MSSPRLLLLGHFGTGNLGNDSTLEAMLQNIRQYQPSASVACVCTGPEIIGKRHGIETFPLHTPESARACVTRNRARHVAGRLAKRSVDEVDFWRTWPRRLRSFDQLIVVGTGAADDMAARPWNAPYDLFKWCKAARSAGSKVVFLSIGAGPIVNRLSRALMLAALQVGDYRSYRDNQSMDYLRSVGFDTAGDCIYPDLVFSLPVEKWKAREPSTVEPRTVGLGVIGYYGWRHDSNTGEPIYREYVGKLKQFLRWLLDQGYFVKILHGNVGNDQRPVDELLDFVQAKGPSSWQAHVTAEAIVEVDHLFRQIVQCDLVVANRFHNVVYALMAGRPVISVGYHWKNDALMAEMGLGAYCQHIEHFTIDLLVNQFESLVSERLEASRRIQQKCNQYRMMLDEQYRRILCPGGSEARRG